MGSKVDVLDEHKVLVLDRAYQPIGVINWERAMHLYVMDKVEVLNFYEDLIINSPKQQFNCPAVIKVNWISKKKAYVHFTRWAVFARDNFTCAYCGNGFHHNQLTLDHVVPDSQGGEKNWQNIVTACDDCNHRKANRTPEQAGMNLYWQPYAPKWNPWFILNITGCKIQEIWHQWLPEKN